MANILNLDWEMELGVYEENIQEQWNLFIKKYNEASEIRISQKIITKIRKHDIPLDKQTRTKINRKNKLWKKYMRTQDKETYQQFCKQRNQIRRISRKAQKIYEKDIMKQIKNNPKKFWNYAQKKMKNNTGIPDLQKSTDEDGEYLTRNDKEKAEVLADFFSSVFTKEPDGNLPTIPQICNKVKDTCIITPKRVSQKLKKT